MAPEDFKRIVESLRIPVAVADPKGVLLFANGAFATLTSRALKDLAGFPVQALFAKDDGKKVLQSLTRVAEGKSANATLDAQVAATVPKWVQASLAAPIDARERPVNVILSLQDIDSQRETETTLNLFAARLFAIADASSIAVMIENASGEIELV